MDVAEASEVCDTVLDEVSDAVIADRAFFETVLMGVVGRGHVLLEDVPGTGKTLTARTVAEALGLSFSRIQFTPDLLPADITGTHVFNERERTFEFNEGPIFANVVLADEINRAPPKTQSALLEAMEEGQVTVDGDTYELPQPFFVIATQNPVEMEGTFELPEAQVDRFLAKTSIGYPEEEGEFELLQRRRGRTEQSPSVQTVLTPEEVDDVRDLPETVTVEDDVLRYIGKVARATRTHRNVDVGVSPRGTQRLFEAVRARAIIQGREFVTPDDVKAVTQAVLAHRIVLTPEARVENVDEADIVDEVLDSVPVPTVAA
ncbi:MoxR-like ATPase [Halomicrobium zhouii]|uniref:MoxR-like ATPase n=1 Tax=Halomicrobium zhouii TaxID=767519 RepID=A0A1I6KKK1_9EURY|nr:MoxR family ATPase [Halomicrobium zhouii]SFR91726.1 MoxR-like ATPase [Halomicrobium zhouii]